MMRILLSVASAQLIACRDALASDLRAVGAEVVVQEDFQQAGASLLEKLETFIALCDRVILSRTKTKTRAKTLQP